jgi:hypothetical protein
VSQDQKQRGFTRFDLRIDGRDVALAREGDQYTGQLRVAMVAYLLDGHTQNSPIVPLDLHFNTQERDKALKDGIPFGQSVALNDNIKSVRFIVYDRGSNQAGSVTIPNVFSK